MTTVHLRFCCLPAERDFAVKADISALLSRSERMRCARLPAAHAARAAVARALVRSELSLALNMQPTNLAFVAGTHGKPSIVDPPQPIAFNLSHSGDWVVLAWHMDADTGPLGVDIEHRVSGERNVMRLARRYFSASEQEALQLLEGEAREALFYRLWTLKEAWVKAHGLALAPQLGSVAFGFPDGVLRVDNQSAHASGRLLHGEPGAHSWASLCVLGQEGRAVTVDARFGMPLGAWTPMSLRGWCGSLAGS